MLYASLDETVHYNSTCDNMKKTLTSLFSLVAIGSAAFAQTTFMFHDSNETVGSGLIFDDEAGSISDTVGGITLTAEAYLDGVSAGTEFNGAGTSFGINAAGTGDETQRFDNDNGIESMVFSFDTAGTFDLIDLRYIDNAGAEAVLSFAGGNTYLLNYDNIYTGGSYTVSQDAFLINESFSAGQLITLSISASADPGQNFSLESFTVSAVPEPSAYAMLTGVAVLGLALCRRKRA